MYSFRNNHEEQLTTSTTSAVKRQSLKRKLEQDFEQQQREDRKPFAIDSSDVASQDLEQEICVHVEILNSKLTSSESDRAQAKAAAHQIAEIAKNDDSVELIVECDDVPALVKHLRAPFPLTEGDVNYEHEVEKRAAAGSLRTLAETFLHVSVLAQISQVLKDPTVSKEVLKQSARVYHQVLNYPLSIVIFILLILLSGLALSRR
ncbi:hypothetical protein ACFE04_028331 [Oxalis oulophora]